MASACSDAPVEEAGGRPVEPREPQRRWPVAVAAGVLAIGGVAGATRAVIGPPEHARIDSAQTSLPADRRSESVDSTTEPAVQTTWATTSSAPLADQLTRPVLDVDGCGPTWADERIDIARSGAYLWITADHLPIQVFVSNGGSLADRYAVAVRSFASPRFSPANANTAVNGLPAQVTFAGDTWGELIWQLSDGSEAYLRTSTMSSNELIDLASSLSPRPVLAQIPAFDIQSDNYEILDEGALPYTVDAITESACEFAGGGWVRISLVDSSAVGQALYLTDRAPWSGESRLLPDGRLLILSAREDVKIDARSALLGVRQATEQEWLQLQGVDPETFEPNRPISPPSTSG